MANITLHGAPIHTNGELPTVGVDRTLRVGITDHAQQELGDIVYFELPEVGQTYAAEGQCALVESVKSASDLYCPVAGEIAEVNEALNDNPELANQSPYTEGWIFRLRPDNLKDIDGLLDGSAYQAEIGNKT